jgi:hypothetical protein
MSACRAYPELSSIIRNAQHDRSDDLTDLTKRSANPTGPAAARARTCRSVRFTEPDAAGRAPNRAVQGRFERPHPRIPRPLLRLGRARRPERPAVIEKLAHRMRAAASRHRERCAGSAVRACWQAGAVPARSFFNQGLARVVARHEAGERPLRNVVPRSTDAPICGPVFPTTSPRSSTLSAGPIVPFRCPKSRAMRQRRCSSAAVEVLTTRVRSRCRNRARS